MRHQHALRRTGRTRREQHVADVVGLYRADARVDGGVVDRFPEIGERVERPIGIGRVVERDGNLEIGKLGPQLRDGRGVVGAEELSHREHDARAAALEDVARFASLEPSVHRNERGTRREPTERRDQPLVTVGCPHREAVAALDTRRQERGGDTRKSATSSVNVTRRSPSTTASASP